MFALLVYVNPQDLIQLAKTFAQSVAHFVPRVNHDPFSRLKTKWSHPGQLYLLAPLDAHRGIE